MCWAPLGQESVDLRPKALATHAKDHLLHWYATAFDRVRLFSWEKPLLSG